MVNPYSNMIPHGMLCKNSDMTQKLHHACLFQNHIDTKNNIFLGPTPPIPFPETINSSSTLRDDEEDYLYFLSCIVGYDDHSDDKYLIMS